MLYKSSDVYKPSSSLGFGESTGGFPLPHQSCPISSKDDNEIRSIKMYSTPCGEPGQTDGHAICTVHNAAQLDSLGRTKRKSVLFICTSLKNVQAAFCAIKILGC